MSKTHDMGFIGKKYKQITTVNVKNIAEALHFFKSIFSVSDLLECFILVSHIWNRFRACSVQASWRNELPLCQILSQCCHGVHETNTGGSVITIFPHESLHFSRPPYEGS